MIHSALDLKRPLAEEVTCSILGEALSEDFFADRRVLVIVPDSTRSCPCPLLFREIVQLLRPSAREVAFVVALGTHAVPPYEKLLELFGLQPAAKERLYPDIAILPHRWDEPTTFREIGAFPAERIAQLTGGLFSLPVRVAVNKIVFRYDLLLIVGPVFPHEVVGFSGGHKYLFPGIGGAEFINFFHWLGAVITNPKINGRRDTPVRRLVEEAAGFLKVPRYAICLAMNGQNLHGIFCGPVKEAWQAATEASASLNIVYKEKPYRSVLACVPSKYEDIWLAGKGMYKLENVVEDGGELIIYGPHIREISRSHGTHLEKVGYHVRDYFLKQWDRFKHYPWAVLAHSTHVRGIGTYEKGVEKPRINVVLATGIPEETCRSVGLGWRDPHTCDPAVWESREEEGLLCVRNAGEVLYRLKNPPPWAQWEEPEESN